MTNFLSLDSVYTPPILGASDAVAKEPHHINSRGTQSELHLGKAGGVTELSLRATLCTHAKIDRKNP